MNTQIRRSMPRRWIVLMVLALVAADDPRGSAVSTEPTSVDDLTFRPTVLVRKGKAQGSGTIVASTEGVTMVLTAAHVVSDVGPLRVELHRYNLGVEDSNAGGPWPKSVVARLVARDVAGDVALLRIDGLSPLPYVAKLADLDALPSTGTEVTSIGIDKGTDFKSWTTRVKGLAQMTTDEKEPRLFVMTEHAPEHGRSGGGLFLADGRLLGVCIGRIEEKSDSPRAIGLFASGPTIRKVIREATR